MSPQHYPPAIESDPESSADITLRRCFTEEQTSLSSPAAPQKDTGSGDCRFSPSLVSRSPHRKIRARSDVGVGDNTASTAKQLPRTKSDRSLRQRTAASLPSLSKGLQTDSADESFNSNRTEHSSPASLYFPAFLGSGVVNTSRSGSSSGSTSTLTPVSHTHCDTGDTPAAWPSHQSQTFNKPDALSFLDPDSPAITKESIQRSVAEANTHWREQTLPISPCTGSSESSPCSAGPYSLGSDASSEQDTEPSTSPEQSVNGDPVAAGTAQAASPQVHPVPLGSHKSFSRTRAHRSLSEAQAEKNAHRYGTPEMPRGNANHPHLPPNALTPRVSNPGQGHINHLPRAEKLPLTGYELLAARLSSHPPTRRAARNRRTRAAPHSDGESGRTADPASLPRRTADADPIDGPNLPPIYRRFEGLNHRILLHLQDELSEMEEQLHRLDTADTQTRRLKSHIVPASRRAEYMAAGELQWHKTDLLGNIGFKLGQYNHVLSSFTATQNLPAPAPSDIQTYRTYLSTHTPIAENETRFLDPTEDLVSLAPRRPKRFQPPSDVDMGFAHDSYYSSLSDEAPRPSHGRSSSSYSVASSIPEVGDIQLPPASLTSSPRPAGHAAKRRSSTRSDSSIDSSKTTTTATIVTGPTAVSEAVPTSIVAWEEQRRPLHLPYLAMTALVSAIAFPILGFLVVQSLEGRVALVAATCLLAGLGHRKIVEEVLSTRDLLACAGMYGLIMALVLYETS